MIDDDGEADDGYNDENDEFDIMPDLMKTV